LFILFLSSSVQTLVNLYDLLYPKAAFDMFQIHQLTVGPVKMVGDVGYLLKQFRGGVA
jgi:hypothetical protein